MPIIWRYLLSRFLKVLFFVLIAFIAVLITARLDEIAHFASLGPETHFLVLFVLYQIPYILPIAIPIACLISAILLFQSMSTTQEMTALRACGFSISSLAAPVIIASMFLAALNFYIISELSTHSHLQTYLLKSELRSINPLLLLNHKHLMNLKGIHFDTLGYSKMGEVASDVVIALPNRDKTALQVLLAKKLEAGEDSFAGEGLTALSAVKSHQFVENVHHILSPIGGFAPLVQKKVWVLNNDQLRMGMLWARLEDTKEQLKQAGTNARDLTRHLNAIYSDFFRRLSLAIAVMTFTIMGLSFGTSISRHRSSKGVLTVLALATFYIVSFFVAKGQEGILVTTTLLYFLPHLMIIFLSLWILRRISKGIETS